jgi:hypothetical protein
MKVLIDIIKKLYDAWQKDYAKFEQQEIDDRATFPVKIQEEP